MYVCMYVCMYRERWIEKCQVRGGSGEERGGDSWILVERGRERERERESERRVEIKFR